MKRAKRASALAVLALGTMLSIDPRTLAANLAIEDFIGVFTGTGVTKSKDADTLGLVKRDLDVTIKKRGDGFSVAWTTVVYRDFGTGAGPQVNRQSTWVAFAPTDDPGIYKGPARQDPFGEGGYAWASLAQRTLTVYLLVVDPTTGVYDLHSYARTLETADDMTFKFSRMRAGRPRVIVEGGLRRWAD